MSLWFRLYTDLPNCVKLRKLTIQHQIGYIWCLCLHKENHLVGQDTQDIAWSLRMELADTIEMLDTLKSARLLGRDLTPVGWEERQFVSDGSTERVRKYRQKQRGNAEVKRCGNVSETADETDQSRAEQSRAEQNRAECRAHGDEFCNADETWNTGQYVAAFHAIPGLQAVPDVSILNALKAEPEHRFRASAWNDFAAAVLGSVGGIESPVAMLTAYMRNARKHAAAPKHDILPVIGETD